MNKKIIATQRQHRRNAVRQLAFLDKIEDIINALSEKLSDQAEVNPAGESLWIEVDNRDDLQAVLALAPTWRKETGVGRYGAGERIDTIDYTATIEGDVYIRVIARQAALPGSCKTVEVEEEIPAQPARKIKRLKVVCNEPKQEAEQPAAESAITTNVEIEPGVPSVAAALTIGAEINLSREEGQS